MQLRSSRSKVSSVILFVSSSRVGPPGLADELSARCPGPPWIHDLHGQIYERIPLVIGQGEDALQLADEHWNWKLRPRAESWPTLPWIERRSRRAGGAR